MASRSFQVRNPMNRRAPLPCCDFLQRGRVREGAGLAAAPHFVNYYPRKSSRGAKIPWLRGISNLGPRIRFQLWIVFVAAAAAGCGVSATARFYTLASTATADDAPAVRYAVLVGPVSVPASVDRPQFVVQVAPNRVEIDEFNRWAAPLNDSIARAVAGNLAALLGTTDVATAPIANFNPAYRVTINVQRFESIQGEAVVVEAVWVVRPTAGGEARSGRTVAREAVQGEGFDTLAAAHSHALAKMSVDIATAIRAAAASTASTAESPRKGAKRK